MFSQNLVFFVFVLGISIQNFGFADAYSEFAEPLKLATPQPNGVYEFELIISEKLTMSTDGENGHVEVLDYDPDKVVSVGCLVSGVILMGDSRVSDNSVDSVCCSSD